MPLHLFLTLTWFVRNIGFSSRTKPLEVEYMALLESLDSLLTMNPQSPYLLVYCSLVLRIQMSANEYCTCVITNSHVCQEKMTDESDELAPKNIRSIKQKKLDLTFLRVRRT